MSSLIDELAALCHHRCRPTAKAIEKITKLSQLVADLATAHLHVPHAKALQTIHIYKLVALWQAEGRCPRRIKDQLHDLYWWAEQVGRGYIFPADFNQPTTMLPLSFSNPAWSLPVEYQVRDRRMQLALLLMEAFGLTLNEAINLHVRTSKQNGYLCLPKTVTHNNEPRNIPMVSKAQKDVLYKLEWHCGSNTLLPVNLSAETYCQQIRKQAEDARMRNIEGLRYQYAQRRYYEMSGQPCPLAGGTPTKFLPPTKRDKDNDARFLLIAELGLNSFHELEPFLG